MKILPDFMPGDTFEDRTAKRVIVVVDVYQDGYDPDDPNDMGSFEYTAVKYAKNGIPSEAEAHSLAEYLTKNHYEKV